MGNRKKGSNLVVYYVLLAYYYGWKDTRIRADERLLPMALIRRKFK